MIGSIFYQVHRLNFGLNFLPVLIGVISSLSLSSPGTGKVSCIANSGAGRTPEDETRGTDTKSCISELLRSGGADEPLANNIAMRIALLSGCARIADGFRQRKAGI
jgi:hypothetical protein